MTATSTHDTKRSEDMRARLAVLSETPREWGIQVNAWSSLAKSAGAPTIDANTEYYLWQSALGGWPPNISDSTSFCERLKAYMLKSVREAGESTSWVSPDAGYEASIIGFVDWLTMNPSERLVRKDLTRYAQAIDKAALNKSLSQVVLKLATPGAPDIYQGQEALDFSFVDPDNRRPIDFAARSRVLDSLISQGESSLRLLLQSSGGERSKEFVTWRMLQLRRELPGLFKLGEYLPLKTSGHAASRVTAFARRHGDHWLIVLAPRLTTQRWVDALPPVQALEPGRRSGCPLDVQRPGEMSLRAKESGLQEGLSRLPGPSRTAFRSSFATCEPLAVPAGSASGEVAPLVSVIVKAHPDAVGAPKPDAHQPASAAVAGLPRVICLPWPAHPAGRLSPRQCRRVGWTRDRAGKGKSANRDHLCRSTLLAISTSGTAMKKPGPLLLFLRDSRDVGTCLAGW